MPKDAALLFQDSVSFLIIDETLLSYSSTFCWDESALWCYVYGIWFLISTGKTNKEEKV
jgi:hypothetical protein